MNHPGKSELVAVLGLGSLESALADALLSDGYQVLVWNCTPSTECGPTSLIA
jgi:3-hydroxyisobutyrate dehydrogenase-like beta-hydroxyacid dehydrogenase